MDRRRHLTDTGSASASLPQDIGLRLQQIIASWQGAQRGEAISRLHEQCVNAVGPSSKLLPLLLPIGLLLVKDLDVATLEARLKGYNGIGRNAVLEFRVPPSGRFDAALVPVGRANESPDRFLLALEENLSLRDQLALYAHAVGHLLLNYQELQTGRRPSLDPGNMFAHADTLAELRALGSLRYATDLDRRVLDAYPLLAQVVEAPEESKAALTAATLELRQRLSKAGWHEPHLTMQYQLTAGRIYPNSTRRGRRNIADALLRASPSLPIAVVRTQRAGESRDISLSILHDYAQRMALPFAYFLDEHGSIDEFDWTGSQEVVTRKLEAFPDRDTLMERWFNALQLTDERARRVLLQPYGGSGKFPRYYQEAAINQAVIAVLQARRDKHLRRLLLTMATGTGKTTVAFQILWKLKKARPIEVRNVLFLTDRDFLVDQAMNEFDPFGAAIDRGRGDPSAVHDVKFYTYQGITATDNRGLPRYQFYPRDFFDVIVVDECHRGSAREASSWREVLKHFSGAVQIGLTATPLSNETVQTDKYFGPPVYTYSLRMGINDGFLAPYRVRRVIIGRSLEEDVPVSPAAGTQEIAEVSAQDEEVEAEEMQQLARDLLEDEDDDLPVTLPATMETADTMRASTDAIAHHLAEYMQHNDMMAKTIVFCVDRKHAAQMRDALERDCGVNNPNYVVRIVSEDAQEGKRALSEFTNPEERYPVVVTTAKLLSTGVDVLTCKNIVLARPVGSMVEFKQIIGRGTRIFGDKKTWFTILDYAGAIKHFFETAFDGDPEFVERELLIPETADEGAVIVEPSPAPSPPEEAAASSEVDETPPATQPSIVDDGQDKAESAQESAGEVAEAVSSSTPPAKNVFESKFPYPEETLPENPMPASHPLAGTVEVEAETPQEPAASVTAAVGTVEVARSVGTADRGNGAYVEKPPVAQVRLKKKRNGLEFRIIGEIVYELGPDGKTLREIKYSEYASTALQNSHVSTAADLRVRWLREEQRAEILAQLEDEGVDLDELAEAEGLSDLDHLDLLLHIVFNEPVLTRAERVARLRQEHAAFFSRYEANPLAKQVLDVILEKYIKGEARDINDVGLLEVEPLDSLGTPLELARSFSGERLRDVLNTLKSLLYRV